MGTKGSSTRSVIFTDAKVRQKMFLERSERAISWLNTLNIGAGGAGCGSCKSFAGCRNLAGKQRIRFRKPIAEFGLIKHKIAEMAIRTFTVESMVYRTAGMTDQILKTIDHHAENVGIQMANGIEEYAIEDSINKVYSSEMLDYIVDEAVQIHGGYGYIHDYAIERGYRDSRINRIWEGTNEINRLLIMDMVTKRAMKNRLPVLVAAQRWLMNFHASAKDRFG
jgi:alkylation response protein AidB-like acyl-CoA dehydrogenase